MRKYLSTSSLCNFSKVWLKKERGGLERELRHRIFQNEKHRLLVQSIQFRSTVVMKNRWLLVIKLYFDKYPIVWACSDFFRALPGAGLGDCLPPARSLSAGAGLGAPDPRAWLCRRRDCTERKAQCKMPEVSTLAIKIWAHLGLSEMLERSLRTYTYPALQRKGLFGGCWYLREAPLY